MEGVAETAFRFFCCWLMVFGVSFCVSQTDGPFALFSRFRKWSEKRFRQEWVKAGVNCPICCSFWIGMVVSGVMAEGMHEGVIMWLSSLGFVCMITSVSPD